jgi:hypothetical protein
MNSTALSRIVHGRKFIDCLVCIGVGLICIFVGVVIAIYDLRMQALIEEYGVYVTATVTRVEIKRSEDDTEYVAHISYMYPKGLEGREYEGTFDANVYTSEGQQFEICINSKNPQQQLYSTGGGFLYVLALLPNASLFIVPGIIIAARTIRVAKWLMRKGKRLQTTFVGVEPSRGFRIKKVHPVAIRTRYTEDGMVYDFFSENIYGDPEPYIRDEIDVLVKPKNYYVYYMDLDDSPPPTHYG